MDEPRIPADNGRFMLIMWLVVLYLCTISIVGISMKALGIPTVVVVTTASILASVFHMWFQRLEHKAWSTQQ